MDHHRTQANQSGGEDGLGGARPSSPSPRHDRRFTLRRLCKRGLRTTLELGQRIGLSILPRHFYSEVPDFRALRRDTRWRRPRSMVGVSGTDLRGQLDFVARCCTPDRIERLCQANIHAQACADNGGPGYGQIEAEFLHAYIQETRPPQVIQVGCGVATAVMLRAAAEVAHEMEMICIDPFPNHFLKTAADDGRLRLIDAPAQQLDPEFFEDLQTGGLLFVDSSHVVGPGSEVNLLILEVLPRLRPGHWIHFHDIYFPYDYQRGLLDDELFFSNETALLLALLTSNPNLTIRASLSMLHYRCPEGLRQFLPNYLPAGNSDGLEASEGHFPSSIFLEVVGEQSVPG
jgi:hypothetical protein